MYVHYQKNKEPKLLILSFSMLKKYKQLYNRGLNYFEKVSIYAGLKGSSPFLCSDFCENL